MELFVDRYNRQVRLTGERRAHIEEDHPEMSGHLDKVENTLSSPDMVVRSMTDTKAELFYRYYKETPVTSKYLCVIVKAAARDSFIITAFFTDKIKRGELLWEK